MSEIGFLILITGVVIVLNRKFKAAKKIEVVAVGGSPENALSSLSWVELKALAKSSGVRVYQQKREAIEKEILLNAG
jgi:hypothetical protein